MDEPIRKSCWGVAAWAMAGFACVMLVAYIAGVAGGGEVVAAAVQ